MSILSAEDLAAVRARVEAGPAEEWIRHPMERADRNFFPHARADIRALLATVEELRLELAAERFERGLFGWKIQMNDGGDPVFVRELPDLRQMRVGLMAGGRPQRCWWWEVTKPDQRWEFETAGQANYPCAAMRAAEDWARERGYLLTVTLAGGPSVDWARERGHLPPHQG